jgi:hypothetical protein
MYRIASIFPPFYSYLWFNIELSKALRYFITVFIFFYSSQAKSNDFEFALIGDLPYGVKENQTSKESEKLIQNLNKEKNLSWVLHVGDIKTGASSCSDTFLTDRKRYFERINTPFVYTPGDNEWTDCHKIPAGSYSPHERLDFIRELFFNNRWAEDARKQLNIITQSGENALMTDFIENYHWIKNDVHFATIHIVGSLDGTKAISFFSKKEEQVSHQKKIEKRQSAALAWLRYTFQKAKALKAKALFIAIHANPGWDRRWEKENRPVFSYFNDALQKELETFDKPVVLAHGDTHTFRIDKPSINGKVPSPSNFTRVETFGENDNAWIKVKVAPMTKHVFSYEIHDRE